MKRWLALVASTTIISSLVISGCSAPTESTSASTTGSATNETATTGSGGTETTGTPPPTTSGMPEKANADSEALPTKPKDGDDVAVLDTSAGKIVVMFYPSKAPKHVANFIGLAKKGFYNGTRFHRCIPGFMIQGGDPQSKDLGKAGAWGTGGNMEGGKEVRVNAEFNDVKHLRGVLSMARSQDPDSASSQFFIMVADNPGLDGQYSAFGAVVSGMEVADKIVASGDANNNGAVDPSKAFMLKSVTVTKWPVK